MRAHDESSKNILDLEKNLEYITSEIKLLQEKENLITYNVFNDSGVTSTEGYKGKTNIFEKEEDKKIMRMFMKNREPNGSLSSLDSNSASARSSIASYQNASDLRDSMVRGRVQQVEQVPITHIKETEHKAPATTDVSADDNSEAPSPTTVKKSSITKRRPLRTSMQSDQSDDKTSDESENCNCSNNFNLDDSICSNCGKSKKMINRMPTQQPAGRRRSIFSKGSFGNALGGGSLLGRTKSIVINNSCAKCKKMVEPAGPLIDHKMYHNECLICGVCRHKLTDTAFSYNNDILCKKCYYVEADLICELCMLPIEKEYITINGKRVHGNCRDCTVHFNLFRFAMRRSPIKIILFWVMLSIVATIESSSAVVVVKKRLTA